MKQIGNSTVLQTDALRDYLNKAVCPKFSFKVPDNENIFNVKRAMPKAYSRYFPVTENLPKVSVNELEKQYSAPSIIVMPREVTRHYDSADVEFHLLFTVYDPGQSNNFDNDGWRSVVNLQDETARMLAQDMHIGNMGLSLSINGSSINYGLINDESSTPDVRPFYMGYMLLTFHYAVPAVKFFNNRPAVQGNEEIKGHMLLD